MSDWIDIGAIESVPVRGARVVRTAFGCIAVFRTAENEIFAIDDKCPHRGGPLSQGIVHGKTVTCPLHNWVIGLESGSVQGPDQGAVRRFPLEVRSGRIFLDRGAVMGKSAA